VSGVTVNLFDIAKTCVLPLQSAKVLLQSTHDASELVATLASGIYIFESPASMENARKFYVVYWPEDMTWNDDAPSGIVKNRVIFMRLAMCLQSVTTRLTERSVI
jgi:hypothetical protein